jgi:hypothetical protein
MRLGIMPQQRQFIKCVVVHVNIPRKMILDCFWSREPITAKQYAKIKRKLVQLETAIHQLQNVKSVVEILESRYIPERKCNGKGGAK